MLELQKRIQRKFLQITKYSTSAVSKGLSAPIWLALLHEQFSTRNLTGTPSSLLVLLLPTHCEPAIYYPASSN